MGEYNIIGGKRLLGQVRIGGSKNAALPILAAAVLGKKSIIHNCPDISDIQCTFEILRLLGCSVSYQGRTAIIDASGINSFALPQEQMEKMRSSIIFAGGLLGRFGEFTAHYPGGCRLGARPVNLHLDAFESLGATIDADCEMIHAKAKKLVGTNIFLELPSVGATQNAMLAAVFAKGKTTITNAAKEPEIVDLQNFLVAAGADIKGAGKHQIVINGVKSLNDVEYCIMPDRIVAGTYLAAASITGGNVKIENVSHETMQPILEKLAETGAKITKEPNAICLAAPKALQGLRHLITGPHPGFPTDMQPQFMALLAASQGHSLIEEHIFESRDKHVDELIKMGADIISFGKAVFKIKGASLLGNTVYAHDLRGGAALVLAGLAAQGQTIVKNSHYIKRGYENLETDLQELGADILLV